MRWLLWKIRKEKYTKFNPGPRAYRAAGAWWFDTDAHIGAIEYERNKLEIIPKNMPAFLGTTQYHGPRMLWI